MIPGIHFYVHFRKEASTKSGNYDMFNLNTFSGFYRKENLDKNKIYNDNHAYHFIDNIV